MLALIAGGVKNLVLSRPMWTASLAVVAAVAGSAYWYREAIQAAYTSIQTTTLATFSLGIVPAGLWGAGFLYALIARRRWLMRVNIWLGGAAFVAAVAGAMSFFQPIDGALAFFTNDGRVSLGGRVGETVSGSASAIGALRVAGVFVVGASFTFPRLSWDVGLMLGRGLVVVGKGLVVLYVLAMLGIKALVGVLARVYRFEGRSRRDPGQVERASTPLTDLPEPAVRARARPDRELAEEAESMPSVKDAALPETALALNGASIVYGNEAAVGAEVIPEEGDASESVFDKGGSTEPESTPDGKFNRFWGPDNGREARNGTAVQTPESDEVPSPPSQDAPPDQPWELPPRSLLVDAVEGGISEDEMAETAETVRQTLAEYGIEVESGEISPGPAVTMYGLIPGWVRRFKQAKALDEDGKPRLDAAGKPVTIRVETKTRVKVDSILSREKDLALALRTSSIRIETPVMGKSMVGIEVPNPEPALVTLGHVMGGTEFGRLRKRAKLPIALGKGSGGETQVVDLAQMPHLLVAGATGSGKSVFINTVISCLLMEKTPAEMRLLLVDPKRVELTPYNGAPHLLTPVVVETDQVVGLLKGLIHEMLSRYKRMEDIGVKNIEGYNRRMPDTMPYIVVAVDELADLMMTAAFDVEQSLCRLAQLGRATGIHLIVATQRPSVDVVTGLIKANFPSRASFGVTSQIDSRTILDTAGAEKLLGRGDMLYQSQDAARPERVQGVFISDTEIEAVMDFWRTTAWRPLPNIPLRAPVGADSSNSNGADQNEQPDGRDELIDKALELAQHYNKLSTSLLQRRLRIGYPRAARLMDQLEEEGIVGPGDGSKSRDVIISSA